MNEQLQSDFDKLVKASKFSNEEIKLKKNFLNKIILKQHTQIKLTKRKEE